MKITDENFMSDTSTSVALGFFDGVHLGHQSIIGKCVDDKKSGLLSCVFTFTDKPSKFFVNKSIPYINDTLSKRNIIKNLGADILIEANFLNIRDLSPEEFVRKILGHNLKAKKIYCGKDFTFGKNASGNTEILKKICEKLGIDVCIQKSIQDEDGKIVSSSDIRMCIVSGEIEKANELLGRNMFYTSEVIKGNQIGRMWGYPTANQILDKGLIPPKYGVYISRVSFRDVSTYAITNVGVKPTMGIYEPLLESHLPFYKGDDFYGEIMKTELLHFVRAEIHFENTELLREQIKKDRNEFMSFIKKV